MPSTSEPRTSTETQKPAIVIHDATKSFKLKHTSSFKETFVAMLKREQLSSQFTAVDGVSLEVPAGQSIALLGRNGSGKSTTLKLLSGVMRPDSGWIRTRGRVAGLLEVGAGFNPNLTGRDNVYLNAAILGMTKEEIDERFDDILEFSEIGEFIDTEVKHYSSGMYSRLGFAVAVHTELDVLLVDEVLSVGDAAFREKCAVRMQQLRAQGKTMFIVSHSAGQVKRLCERGVVLDQGRIIFDGPIGEALNHLQRMKSDFIRTPDGDEVAVVGQIRAAYDRAPARFGLPLGMEVRTAENGGGSFQEFTKGIIMVSDEADHATALLNGPFLRVYQLSGGPSGPWGFRTGKTSGSPLEGGVREIPFQNGIASYSDLTGVRFSSHHDEPDASGTSSTRTEG